MYDKLLEIRMSGMFQNIGWQLTYRVKKDIIADSMVPERGFFAAGCRRYS